MGMHDDWLCGDSVLNIAINSFAVLGFSCFVPPYWRRRWPVQINAS